MLGWEFPPFISGGLGTHCLELTKALSAKGVKIDFYMPKTDYDINPGWLDVYQVDWSLLEGAKFKGKHSYKVPYEFGPYAGSGMGGFGKRPTKPSSGSKMSTKAYDLDFFEAVSLYNYLAQQIAVRNHFENPYDLVHCHDWISSKAAIAIKAATGIPLVTTIHSTEYDRSAGLWPTEWILDIEREAVHASDRVITVSKRSRDQISEKFRVNPDKISVIYNAIDCNKFPNNRRKLSDAGRESKVVLYHGRLSIQKGVEFFLNAAAKVLSKDRDVRFIISGKGDMLPRLVDQCMDLGIQDKVSFLGYVSPEDLQQIYATSDLFVLPSVSEPFGIAALEAMSAGTPVLLSKTSGVSELVKNCLTVDFWDVDEMASKMLAVLTYGELSAELSNNSVTEARTITWDDVATKTIDAYSRAIIDKLSRPVAAGSGALHA